MHSDMIDVDDSSIIPVAGGIAGTVLITLLIVILILWCCSKHKRKSKPGTISIIAMYVIVRSRIYLLLVHESDRG